MPCILHRGAGHTARGPCLYKGTEQAAMTNVCGKLMLTLTTSLYGFSRGASCRWSTLERQCCHHGRRSCNKAGLRIKKDGDDIKGSIW